MESGANVKRYATTAIIMKQPVLVVGTIVFVLALLSTHYDPQGTSHGGIWPWVGLAVVLAVCALVTWMLCSSQEVEIDPDSRRVTQWHRFLKYETAKNQWDFSQFTGVRVEQATDKEQVAATSPGSGFRKVSSKTVYSHSYKISLLRAHTVVTTPERQINVPHYPLELPMEKQNNPLPLEDIARQLSQLGGWPATRRGYTLVAGAASGDVRGAYTVQTSPENAESPIAPMNS